MNKLLKFFLKIMYYTPWYAWLAIVYIAWVAKRTKKEHATGILELFCTPLLLTGLHIWQIICFDPYYLLSLFVGTFVGYRRMCSAELPVCKKESTILIPASWQSIYMLITLFAVYYIFGYFTEHRFLLLEEFDLNYVKSCIDGLIGGFFWGNSMVYISRLYAPFPIEPTR